MVEQSQLRVAKNRIVVSLYQKSVLTSSYVNGLETFATAF